MASDISLLKVSQHELGTIAPPELRHDPEFRYCIGRACLPHVIEASRQLRTGTVNGGLGELLGFIVRNGAHTADGQGDTPFYRETAGWLHTPLADRERSRGQTVVLQNLIISLEQPVGPAIEAGRVRSEREIALLKERMKYGGPDRSQWIDAVQDTLDEGGSAIPLVSIPGMFGDRPTGHSVLVKDVTDGVVSYFDPDMSAIERYRSAGLDVPNITRVDDWHGTFHLDSVQPGYQGWTEDLRDAASIATGPELLYQQPVADFTARMTGEVMHVFDD